MISFFNSLSIIETNQTISHAADKLFRIPHDQYEQRIMAAVHLIHQLDTHSDAKKYFEDLLEKIHYEQDEANSSPKASKP
jgi:uncharacterized FlgJ-related protein